MMVHFHKRTTILNLVMCMWMVGISSPCFSQDYITVIDRSASQTSNLPIKESGGVLYYPVINFFQILNADIDWDYVTGIALIKYQDHSLKLAQGSKGIMDGDQFIELDAASRIFDGSLWLSTQSLTIISDQILEGNVTWNSEQKTLNILSTRASTPDPQVSHELTKYIIVLDAGHGGSDTGSIWLAERFEKDITLRLCDRTGQLLTDRLGAEIRYTRSGDYHVALADRTKVANSTKADIFVSIHLAKPSDVYPNGFVVYTIPSQSVSKNTSRLPLWRDCNPDITKKSVGYADRFGAALARGAAGTTWERRDLNISVLTGLTVPGFLIEISSSLPFYGGISLEKDSGENRAAEAIYDGIKAALELTDHAGIN